MGWEGGEAVLLSVLRVLSGPAKELEARLGKVAGRVSLLYNHLNHPAPGVAGGGGVKYKTGESTKERKDVLGCQPPRGSRKYLSFYQ
jgi:hypothetical protein